MRKEGLVLKIGQFSKISKLTPKALRHYEAKGILIPAHIDKDNGFRYYETEQLQLATLIKMLRDLDMSIDQIRQILQGEDIYKMLQDKANQLNAQKSKIDISLNIINSILKEKKMNYQVEEKIIPQTIVYSAETVLEKYADIMQWIPAIGQECCKLNPELKCTEPPYEFCEFLDCEYKETDIKVRHNEAVEYVGIENENIKFRTIPETKVICIQHKGPYETIGEAYSFIVNYAKEYNYTIDGIPRESYIDGVWNKDDPQDWLTEIQLPVK